MKILMSGASGTIGAPLAAHLSAASHEVIHLVRCAPNSADEREWAPSTGQLDPAVFDGVDAVINLSGAGIGDRRWSAARRREIIDSRLETTRLLSSVMAALPTPPATFISQSAIGYYGNRGEEVLTESSGPGPAGDFLTGLTIGWESAADSARAAGIRVVHPRTGLVLVPGVQLLGRLVPLFKAGLGGRLGDGAQWWSWIALADQITALTYLLTASMDGPVNLVSPNPVRNSEFVDALGSALGRPTVFRIPRTAIRAAMGREMADELSLSSTRVLPVKLLEAGFRFEHETIDGVLSALQGQAAAGTVRSRGH